MPDRDIPTTPSSGFAPYRRRQALAKIAEHVQQVDRDTVPAAFPPPIVAPLDVGDDRQRRKWAALPSSVRRLTPSPDPTLVFRELAALLVPLFCEWATAVVRTGDDMAQRQLVCALNAEIPTARIDERGRGWIITVYIAGHPADNGDPVYVAALTCTGHTAPPAPADVAMIKLAGQHAAATVHRAQLEASLAASQHQVTNVRAALTSNRIIGAAAGILMQQRKITYPQALELLWKTSQNQNIKLAVLAEMVLYTGAFPPVAQPRTR